MGCGTSRSDAEAIDAKKKKEHQLAFRVRLIGAVNCFSSGFSATLPRHSQNANTQTQTESAVEADKAVNVSDNDDAHPDPYVTLRVFDCEGRPLSKNLRTSTQEHTAYPNWNEEFYFLAPGANRAPAGPEILLTLHDARIGNDNDVIGITRQRLDPLIMASQHEVMKATGGGGHQFHTVRAPREFWVPLAGSGSQGEIGFSIVECYRLDVTVNNAMDLAAADLVSGTSDCYVTMNLGQHSTQQTTVKPRTVNPVWNETFSFYAPYDPVPCQLEMQLWDHDSTKADDNIGWCCFQVCNGVVSRALTRGRSQEKVPSGSNPLSVHEEQGDISTGDSNGKCEGGEGRLVVEEDEEDPDKHVFPVRGCGGQLCVNIKAEFGADYYRGQLKEVELPPMMPKSIQFHCTVLGAYNLGRDFAQGLPRDLASIDAAWVKENRTKLGAKSVSSSKLLVGRDKDCFVEVHCEGSKAATRRIKGTEDDLWWNQRMRFVAHDRDESTLNVHVWDHNIFDDTDLGHVRVPIHRLKSGQGTEIWSQLNGRKAAGEVGFKLHLNHRIKVQVIRCTNLTPKDLNGLCDPYVKLVVGSAKVNRRDTAAGALCRTAKTRVVRDTLNPWFEEEFRFSANSLKGATLSLEVWDRDLALPYMGQGLLEEFCGSVELDIEDLEPGVAVKRTLDIKTGSERKGQMTVILTDEVRLPEMLQLMRLDQVNGGRDGDGPEFITAIREYLATDDTLAGSGVAENQLQQSFNDKLFTRPRFAKMIVGPRAFAKCNLSDGCTARFSYYFPMKGITRTSPGYKAEEIAATVFDPTSAFLMEVPIVTREMLMFTCKLEIVGSWSGVEAESEEISMNLLSIRANEDTDLFTKTLFKGGPPLQRTFVFDTKTHGSLEATIGIRELPRWNIKLRKVHKLMKWVGSLDGGNKYKICVECGTFKKWSRWICRPHLSDLPVFRKQKFSETEVTRDTGGSEEDEHEGPAEQEPDAAAKAPSSPGQPPILAPLPQIETEKEELGAHLEDESFTFFTSPLDLDDRDTTTEAVNAAKRPGLVIFTLVDERENKIGLCTYDLRKKPGLELGKVEEVEERLGWKESTLSFSVHREE